MTQWNVDVTHSNVGFSVRHMMIAKVKGNFTEIEGTLNGNPEDFANANIAFNIKTASIDTNNEDRDNHLRSGDFFDAEVNPNISFKSSSITEKGGNEYVITGDLTIKGETKEVSFDAEYLGTGQSPWGVDVAAFEAKTKISREAFGLTWNQTLETGGVLVGDDIEISVEVQLNPAS